MDACDSLRSFHRRPPGVAGRRFALRTGFAATNGADPRIDAASVFSIALSLCRARLVFAIGALARARFLSHADIDGAGLTTPTAGARRRRAIVQDTPESSVLAVIVCSATRSVWAVSGAHFGWNVMQAGVLGLAVSGRRSSGIFRVALHGQAWIAGGGFGPEGSAFASLVMGVTVVGLAVWAGRGPNWRPARMRLAADAAGSSSPTDLHRRRIGL